MAIRTGDVVIAVETDHPRSRKVDGKYVQYRAIIEDELLDELFIQEDDGFDSHPDPFGDMEYYRDHFNV